MTRYQRKRARYRARSAAWRRRSDARRIDTIIARLSVGTPSPVLGYRTRVAAFGPPTFLLSTMLAELRAGIEAVAAACRTVRIEPLDEVSFTAPRSRAPQ